MEIRIIYRSGLQMEFDLSGYSSLDEFETNEPGHSINKIEILDPCEWDSLIQMTTCEEAWMLHELQEEIGDDDRISAAMKIYDDVYEIKKGLDDDYIGYFSDREDFGRDYCGDMLEVPDNIWFYVDWEALGQAMFCNGDYTEEDGYYFRR